MYCSKSGSHSCFRKASHRLKFKLFQAIGLLFLTALIGKSAENWEQRFSVGIKPLLVEKCFFCHGNGDVKFGNLDLTSRETMLAGRVSRKTVLAPGSAAQSLLYSALAGTNPELLMQPKENDRLTALQVSIIRDWIEAGAHWPAEEMQSHYVAESLKQEHTIDGVRVTTSGGQSDEWTNRFYEPEDLWAF